MLSVFSFALGSFLSIRNCLKVCFKNLGHFNDHMFSNNMNKEFFKLINHFNTLLLILFVLYCFHLLVRLFKKYKIVNSKYYLNTNKIKIT